MGRNLLRLTFDSEAWAAAGTEPWTNENNKPTTMRNPDQKRALLAATALVLCLLAPGAFAANLIWNGGGTDNNWNTGDNWGGTAPVNGDNLIFSGANRQDTTNNIGSLTTGWLRFANGGFTLNGNPFTLSSSTTAMITNSAGTNVIACPLTIGPTVAKYWFVEPNSEVRLAGVVNNTAASGTSIGWMNLTNGGTVRIMNTATSTRGMDLFYGTVIIDGGFVDASNDGFCFKAPTGLAVTMQITNNGTVRVGGGGNFRVGNGRTALGSAAGPDSLNRVDLSSGMLELYGANVVLYVGDNVAGAKGVFNQNGGLVWGSAGSGNTLTIGGAANTDGTYNLNGGVLWIAQVRQGNSGATNVVFNFNGGTLKPTASSTTFFEGLLNANVQSGGAIIDTTNLSITLGQWLQGNGGLTKLGTGTLTLTGINYYSGPTVVSNGTLATSSMSFLGGGAITVANDANLSLAFTGTPLSASTLTVGSSVTNSLSLDLGTSPFPGANPVISVNTLNGTGTALINITGSGFAPGSYPLIGFVSGTGLNAIKLGSIPLGLSATLVQSANALSLNVSLVPKHLTWSGAHDGNWDTTTFNWLDLDHVFNPTNYSQSGGKGDAVTFDDTVGGGVTTINIGATVTPAQVVANNNVSYTFTGAGSISGPTSLIKDSGGFGTLTIANANGYTGGTVVNAGNLYVANDQALGTGPVTLNLGTLASASTTGRTLLNTIVVNGDNGVVLGDTVNTGTLTLPGKLDLGGGNGRTLNLNSDVVVTGSLTNGGFTTKTGPGQLIIKGASQQTALVNQQQGDVIIDGGWLDSGDGWRLQNYFFGAALRFAVTNGGLFTLNRDSANFRVGLNGGDNSSDNILDIAGTVSLYSATGNGRVDMGQSGANDILNLRAGGRLICRSITSTSPGYTEVNLDGGTLAPIANEAAFMQGLTNAFVQNGGVSVDTTNFNITIAQPLLGAGAGGLTKLGSGALTLSGANTYTGTTAVNEGKLVLGASQSATGGITVASNGTLAFLSTSPGTTVTVPSVASAGGSALEAQFSGLTNNPTAPAGLVNNLSLNGTVGANLVAGNIRIGAFPLFGYNTISGTGSIVIGQLPQGVVGVIATNTVAKTIDLVVSSVTPTLWNGSVSGNWDTTTTNWTVAGTPTIYAQGDNVRFDDSASNPAVTMTVALSPGAMTVSNSALSYQFGASGAGGLSGSMSLTKDGTNSMTLSSPNSFLGTVMVKAGTLVAGNATALGSDTAGTIVQGGGALDVNGNNLGLEPVVLAGGGPNGLGALDNSGADQNNALRDVTLTAATVIHANATLGIRMPNDTDPGFHGNGYKLTKTGSGQVNLNGGQTNPGTTIWDCDLGDVDILEGTLSFQRRMTLGRATNSIHVAPGATLMFFALSTAMPVQVKPVYLTNATLSANGNSASEGTTFGGPITLVSGSNSVAALTGTTLELLGPISGAGDLYNTSGAAATVALGGTNTCTGATVVQSGTLRLESTALLASTPSIQVAAGATLDVSAFFPWTLAANQTLGGSGTVNGSVQANGTVSPGASIGALTFNNDLSLAGTSIMELSKDGGLTNDTVTVNGILTFGGTLQVVLTGSTPLAVDDTFKLYNFLGTPTGSLTLNLPAGYTWDTTRLSVDGTIKVTGVLSAPQIGTVTVSGGNLTMTGTGGSAGGTYHILSSTNVALPLAAWSPVLTNSFAADGSFTNTLPVLSSEPRRFYIVISQ